jgi:hypothetical protein
LRHPCARSGHDHSRSALVIWRLPGRRRPSVAGGDRGRRWQCRSGCGADSARRHERPRESALSGAVSGPASAGAGPSAARDLVGAENLCHQAIFVDDATRAVMPPDPEMIQVDDAIWQGPQWRGLVQGAVRPLGVVEVLVLPQHHHQVALVPDQGPVQQLTSAAANPPLHDRIHSRCLNGGADDPDPVRAEVCPERKEGLM